MGQRRALRASGRAGREEDHERVVLVDEDDGQVDVITRARGHLLDERRERDHRHVAVVDADVGQPLQPGVVTEQHLGRGEFHAVGELGTRPPSVETDDDPAEGNRRPLRQRVREAVDARERDPVALRHAVLVDEHGGDRRDTRRQLRERDRLVGEPEVRPVAELRDRVVEHFDQAVRSSREDLDVGPEHLLRRPLERRARTGERGPLFLGQAVVVVPPQGGHFSFSTRSAFSRRNFGQTWSRNGTSTMSPMIRSRVRPIGKYPA